MKNKKFYKKLRKKKNFLKINFKKQNLNEFKKNYIKNLFNLIN